MKILVIDHYDSFVYNLIYLIKSIQKSSITIMKSDQIDLKKVQDFDKILLSPGPGLPQDYPQVSKLLTRYAPTKDILGVCLGHQSLALHFNGELQQLNHPLHGVSSLLNIIDQPILFANVPQNTPVAHYHSWIVSKLPACLMPLAFDPLGNIMAFTHKSYKITGIQFHPESILTPKGKQIITNWLNQK